MKRLTKSSLLDLREPPDGLTPEETVLKTVLADASIETLYAKLPTSRMKAIVALHYELGYNQEMVAKIFGVSQERICVEIKNIRRVFLGQPFRGSRPKITVRTEDVLHILHQLHLP